MDGFTGLMVLAGAIGWFIAVVTCNISNDRKEEVDLLDLMAPIVLYQLPLASLGVWRGARPFLGFCSYIVYILIVSSLCRKQQEISLRRIGTKQKAEGLRISDYFKVSAGFMAGFGVLDRFSVYPLFGLIGSCFLWVVFSYWTYKPYSDINRCLRGEYETPNEQDVISAQEVATEQPLAIECDCHGDVVTEAEVVEEITSP